MKRLLLVRHAKAEKKFEVVHDYDRPLNEKGVNQSIAMPAYLKSQGIVPDVFITSPAVRAASTALIFARMFNFDPAAIVFNPMLYLAEPEVFGELVAEVRPEASCALIFAHNPGISIFASEMLRTDIDLPTCGVCEIRIEGEWKDILKGRHGKGIYMSPKQLRMMQEGMEG